MAKIMLVEDDNNLREIYEARLLAEGYEIVAAKDGEEALAMAVKERPDLIISDVMMPKISGFDMLDILRSTTETKDTKVIMMTALSQAEDKARADKLGADRYLVKSQVTLEDVAKVAREVLEDDGSRTEPKAEQSPPAPPAPVGEPSQTPAPSTPMPPPEPVVTTPMPVAAPPPESPTAPPLPAASNDDKNANTPPDDPQSPKPPDETEPPATAAPQSTPPSPAPPSPPASPVNDDNSSGSEPATQPADNPSPDPAAKPATAPPASEYTDLSQIIEDEQVEVEKEIKEFVDKPAPKEAEEVSAPAPNAVTGSTDTTTPVPAVESNTAGEQKGRISNPAITGPVVVGGNLAPEPTVYHPQPVVKPALPDEPKTALTPDEGGGTKVNIAGKKVISPLTIKKPGDTKAELDRLLAEENRNSQVGTAPANTVIKPVPTKMPLPDPAEVKPVFASTDTIPTSSKSTEQPANPHANDIAL